MIEKLIHQIVTKESFGKGFSEEERELLAECSNKLLDKFENLILIAAHLNKEGENTSPVTACFYGTDKFKTNVAIRMYNDPNINKKLNENR